MRRLVAFIGDALRYAAATPQSTGAESIARRLIVAPYSGLGRADASALVVAAGDRATLDETIASERLVLEREPARAAHCFVAALAEIARAYRTQGATVRELVATVRLGFRLDDAASAAETATLEALDAAAGEFDAAAGVGWELDAALAALAATVDASVASLVPSPLRPLPACAPEDARVVRRRRTHYSASSLGTYAECERRWYYRYVCGAIEDKSSSASVYGSAFHWALERFHQEVTRADAAPPDVLAIKLDGWIQTAFEHYRSGFETAVE